MEVNIKLMSEAMNHLTDLHDKLLEIEKRNQVFMIDEYIRILSRTIDDLGHLKYNAHKVKPYLEKEEKG